MLRLPVLFSLLLTLTARAASGQEVAKAPLPALPLKGALGAVPLNKGGASTLDLIALIEEATAKGRLAHEASREFEERYRIFVGSLRDWQKRGSPGKVCQSPEAARAYLEGASFLDTFQKRRAEFAALIAPLKEAKGATYALTPARLHQIERILAYHEEAKALEPYLEGLFSQQMKGEIESMGCSKEALAEISREKPQLASLYGSALEPTRPRWLPSGLLPPAKAGRVPFTINNVDCETPFLVVLDGETIGTASAQGVTSFTATEGWHSLCLAAEGDRDLCYSGASGVRTYIYEGWWVRAQCPSSP